MAPAASAVHTELIARREKLEAVRAVLPHSDDLSRLLFEVDAALARVENGTYGLCEVCHDAIEAQRIAIDPLARTCIDHMTADQRRAVEQDLDLAGRIQHVLLPPRRQSAHGWTTAYEYEPLRAASGDFCDLIPTDHGDLLFLVGDVAGKGVAASVLMAHLHAMFRSLVSLRLPFGELIQRANRIFCESTGGQHYATLVCGRAARDGEIELCNAGHCPPLLVRGAGPTVSLPATGLPIGLFCSASCEVTRATLGAGDVLLIYTDGVTEASDASGAEYGTARLESVVARARHGSPADLVAACARDVAAFRGAEAAADDVTIFAIGRTA